MSSKYDRRVYRANPGGEGGDPRGAEGGGVPAGGRTRREGRRSRALAVIVLVLVAIVIALAGVAANSSAFQGSQGEPGTFKLIPLTTTTS